MAMLDKIREERREKVKELRKRGINPYPSKSGRTHMAREICDAYDKHEGNKVTVAGRVMTWRDFGKLIFAQIRDGSGDIQIMMRKDGLGDMWKNLDLFDAGDFVDATGKVTKTKTGEVTVELTDLRMLAKAVRPLPEKWAGLKDDDVRFRRRYLDFLANPESKDRIAKRGKLLQYIRQFMWDKGFVEIENPTLENNPAGAEARPFITHINAYDMDMYLRICIGELWQKVSTVGGFEKVFEIGRAYRNEGVDAEHNPEFSMMEFYWAFATIEDNIKLHQELFSGMAKEITGSYTFTYKGKEFDLTPPIAIAKYNDLVKEHTGLDLEKYEKLENLKKAAEKIGVEELEDVMGWSSTIDSIWKQKVRPNIIQPVFVIDYPYILTPLAKRVEGDERFIQMSQMVMDGMEMCRIYGELNDPTDQIERFKEHQDARDKGDEETWAADYEYAEAMEYGMPPQTGSGVGIDRWVKVLTDADSLREVIAYPIMRPEREIDAGQVSSMATGKLNADFEGIFAEHGVTVEGIEIPEIEGDEYLSMSDEFQKKYPTATAGYVVMEDVNVKDSNKELDKLKGAILRELKGLRGADIDSNRKLQSYRAMYEKMGIDWHSRRPSPEALLRRVMQGKDLYTVNSMVDAYNLVVMTQQVSVGTFDLDHMELPLELRIAEGGEKFTMIGGDEKTFEKGEVAYFDKKGPYNMDYNYRDSERTKTRLDSKRIIINAEGVGDITSQEVSKTLQLAAATLKRYCGGKVVGSGIVHAN